MNILNSESKTDPRHDSRIFIRVYCFEVERVKFIRRHREPSNDLKHDDEHLYPKKQRS